MVLSAIVIGGLYPAIVQKFQVQPNQRPRKRRTSRRTSTRPARRTASGDPSHRRRRATRTAADHPVPPARDAAATASVTLLDADVVSPAVPAAPAGRRLLPFASPLAVDRYPVGRPEQDPVVGAPRAEPRRRAREDLDQRALRATRTATASSPPTPTPPPTPAPRCSPNATCRPPAPSARTNRGSTTASGPPSTRWSAARPRRSTTPTRAARRAPGSPAPGGVSLANTFTRAAFAVQTGEPQCSTPTPSAPAPASCTTAPHAARPGGRALAHRGQHALPGGGRRARAVDRRRLHHQRRLSSLRVPYEPSCTAPRAAGASRSTTCATP